MEGSCQWYKIGNASKRLMSKLASKTKKLLTYPSDTSGSKLAAEMRKKANKMSSEQKSHYLRKAMALIYGRTGAKAATGAGR